MQFVQGQEKVFCCSSLFYEFVLCCCCCGKYSGLTNPEICKMYRNSIDQSKLKKQEQQRKKKWHKDLKGDPEMYKEYLAKERFRKSHAKAVRIASQSSSQSSPSVSTSAVSNSAFSTKQLRHRSLTKAEIIKTSAGINTKFGFS